MHPEDADSYNPEKESKTEGAFYVWTESEIDTILNDGLKSQIVVNKSSKEVEKCEIFKAHFEINPGGNCTLSRLSDPHSEFTNKNCLIVLKKEEEMAEHFELEIDEYRQILVWQKSLYISLLIVLGFCLLKREEGNSCRIFT